MRPCGVPLLMLWLAGCASDIHEIGREPKLAAIGAGTWTDGVKVVAPPPAQVRQLSTGSIWQASGADLFRDSRARRAGDVLTVKISIADKASVDTKSNRSRKSARDASLTYDYGYSFPSSSATGKLDGKIGLSGDTTSDGKGATSRAESIDVRIAAIVSEVLPNGNLLISGSQEVRVNYELRVVSVAGLIRPNDIGADNTIPYERIAEARISYGGRGRAMEVQQPGWGQQIIDILSPL